MVVDTEAEVLAVDSEGETDSEEVEDGDELCLLVNTYSTLQNLG